MRPDPSRRKTRERILDVAMDLFSTDGFTGTSISEIERRVGLAAGTGSMYRHFTDKAALLRAAVEREVARCRAAMESTTAVISRDDEGRAEFYKLMFRDITRFNRLFRLMLNEGDRVPELREAIRDALRPPDDGLRPEDLDVFAVAVAALGGYHLFSMMQDRPFRGVDPERFIKTLVTLTRPRSVDAPG